MQGNYTITLPGLVIRQYRSAWPIGARKDNKCSWCSVAVNLASLKAEDKDAAEEYDTSGLCLACQRVGMIKELEEDQEALLPYHV